jgi:hypothetical protein
MSGENTTSNQPKNAIVVEHEKFNLKSILKRLRRYSINSLEEEDIIIVNSQLLLHPEVYSTYLRANY